jgi:hypothetical protein
MSYLVLVLGIAIFLLRIESVGWMNVVQLLLMDINS